MPANFPAQTRHASKKLLDCFQEFINTHPPASVNRHVRCLLLDYVRSRLDTGFPIDFDIYLEEFYDLFELLDRAAEESN